MQVASRLVRGGWHGMLQFSFILRRSEEGMQCSAFTLARDDTPFAIDLLSAPRTRHAHHEHPSQHQTSRSFFVIHHSFHSLLPLLAPSLPFLASFACTPSSLNVVSHLAPFACALPFLVTALPSILPSAILAYAIVEGIVWH